MRARRTLVVVLRVVLLRFVLLRGVLLRGVLRRGVLLRGGSVAHSVALRRRTGSFSTSG
ncbi:hypothetical protein [Leucobacter chromiireducens]|uniref:hypothetical protein n=1 Tax=Leucobacter chromiireducens TaxID=283877 RepID=UPI001929126C|nr:hypothetical protein [Leucobacter chromiireducens]